MNKRNYQAELEKIISGLDGKKPKLFMHACCAPCASYCVAYLKDFFDITLFYYNPNITDFDEYQKRLFELEKFAQNFSIKVVDGGYSTDEFFTTVKGLESEVEGGKRCFACYKLRLDKTARLAKENGYDYFCSTLSISPLKNSSKLNEIGEALSVVYGVKHLPNDFKKKGGYLRSVELSKEYGLYRQDYCGCVFSKR